MNDGMIELPFDFLFSKNKKNFSRVYKRSFFSRRPLLARGMRPFLASNGFSGPLFLTVRRYGPPLRFSSATPEIRPSRKQQGCAPSSWGGPPSRKSIPSAVAMKSAVKWTPF